MAKPRGVDALGPFHAPVREWFTQSFTAPTPAQTLGWAPIARGDSTLVLAPTGSGKTLAAFLWCIDRVMFDPLPQEGARCRVLYVSPLKALAVDVERNLRAPISGISKVAAARGVPFVLPAVAVRTGDTPAAERARFRREPADILITTPESLYLLLTSKARDALRSIDTVIIDEIHALVPTKRGVHLALSLERLERRCAHPPQRIGLSATARPLEEVARFLGGIERRVDMPPARRRRPGRARALAARAPADSAADIHDEFTSGAADVHYRAVSIVNAGGRKRLELRVEVPIEDLARLGEPRDLAGGPASQGVVPGSIWGAIHPRLLELVRQHRSTLIFVNSRRIAERLASALNDLAGEPLVGSHHGSLAREQRSEVEDRLKAGAIRGLVATSSLELGIDMGAIDLVVQIEAPPSVASGMQRIGRAGHHVDAISRGAVFPKYRGDLVACAAVTREMHEGRVEATRYPRNPLDVLAQQIVAMASMDRWDLEELYGTIRRAAPYAYLGRHVFEGVLDMLAGRYPSDGFAELRPRITWDRIEHTIEAREGARRIAVINGGTIPDRGLYGVFLAGAAKGMARVGELDEEMVFESRVGETFLLGASTWRIEEITHDRVMVSPAPGEPGKMPFWHGDAAGRPLELGRTIGRFIRELREMPRGAAIARLVNEHDLDQQAAENLLRYLDDQLSAAKAVPDDRTILIEQYRDELGDWRVSLLSPLGGRIHAPWSMAAVAKVREALGIEVETMWTDEGFVVRFPDTEEPPDPRLLVPGADEVERLVLGQLGSSALFAAKFREAAARALLLPRRRPGGRAPLWQQRKRAADLLAVASRFGSFPILLETYRETLRDVFDMPALVTILRQIANRSVRVVPLVSAEPSPFASTLLFGYIANYIYDGDAPLAERRAQALAIDQAQLRELLGDAELRELLDPAALETVEHQLQRLEDRQKARSPDAIHDLLLRLGDLSETEIERRSAGLDVQNALHSLLRARRLVPVPLHAETRYIAVEDASRYRDALGIPLPSGLPRPLLEPVADPVGDLVSRFARTHGPFTTGDLARHYGLGHAVVETTLRRVAARGKLVEGEFRPGGLHREWCEPDVLRLVRQRSLAKLRHEVEPVEPAALARLMTNWQGLARKRRTLDALLDSVDNLQGAPIAASILESEILPARIDAYEPGDLDALLAAGEVVWVGLDPLGDRDGRIALYLTDHLARLWRPSTVERTARRGSKRDRSRENTARDLGTREHTIIEVLRERGASFFAAVHEAVGGGYPGETLEAIWNLVWRGLVTNDTFQAVRAFTRPPERQGRTRRRPTSAPFRSRRQAPPTGQGRWSLVEAYLSRTPSSTEWTTNVAQQLLSRYGVVSREVASAEWIPGGFGAIYEVLRALEEGGKIRRGYFVSGVAATQFAEPAAVDLLRAMRDEPALPERLTLAATDPANPYGAILKWPTVEGPRDAQRGPTRSVGATVVLVNGALVGFVSRGGRQLLAFLPEDEPKRSTYARGLASALAEIARQGEGRQGGLLISEINGAPAADHPLAPFLLGEGFTPSTMGFHVVRQPRPDRPTVQARGPTG
ncbi:MAG: DEAD/DEAH box helicase [Acidobacteria bacterium]|nr:DEAD/DEAH box helicase [Acidobacteriota bacterium]